MNILITGGTGFIGEHLVRSLTKDNHQVTILSRRERKSTNRYLSYLKWDGTKMPMGIGLYEVVINMAGASIAEKKWTDSHKELIIESRKSATKACVNYINQSPNPPKVFISASAVGYYGVENDGKVDESTGPGSDFAAEVCQMWEEEAQKANCRTVRMRIGVVVGKGGGAMEKMLPIYKFYLGGKFASGKQGFPWVHIDDIVKSIRFCIDNEKMEGPVNFVGPEMVDQSTFSHQLAQALGTKDLFTIPKFVINILFGEQGLLFWGGQKVIPRKLQNANYKFLYPDLKGALEDVVG